MNIKQFILDRNLAGRYLQDKQGSLKTWRRWIVALCVMFGLPIPTKYYKLIRKCTGRDPAKLPKNGFKHILLVIGRRSGKTIISAIIAVFIALFSGKEKLCKPGEKPMVALIAVTTRQAKILRGYIEGIFNLPLLKNQVVSQTQWALELKNGVQIEVLVGDYRSVRGFSLLAVIVDELAFFGYGQDSKVKSDTELVRALLPGLATLDGWFIGITSPYAKMGFVYRTWKRNQENPDTCSTLVWNCPSRTMNPTLKKSIVEKAMADDLQAAKSEYLGEFRDDVILYITRELLESVVIKNRKELLPRENIHYFAFVDLSGGRSDAAALSIAHKEDKKIIIDFLKEYKAPFNPHQVIRLMCDELRRYNLRQCTGDFYSAEFTVQSFRSNGVSYHKSTLPKSNLYLELLPRICSQEIELLDHEKLINQLASLERKTHSGGKDTIDHPTGGHDDVANVIAGVCVSAAKPTFRAGAIKVQTTTRRFFYR